MRAYTGNEIKAAIYGYLLSRGWILARPGEQLGWRDEESGRLYQWVAAFVVELARELKPSDETAEENKLCQPECTSAQSAGAGQSVNVSAESAPSVDIALPPLPFIRGKKLTEKV